jgi:hypothetical protein
MPSYTFDIDKIYLGGTRTNKFLAQTRPDDVSVASPICKLMAVPQPGTFADGNVLLSINSVGITGVHNPNLGFFGGWDTTISSVVLQMTNGTDEDVTLSFNQSHMSDDFDITNSGNWIFNQNWSVASGNQTTLEILDASTFSQITYSSSTWRYITGQLDVVGDDTSTVYIDGDAGGHVHVRYIIDSLGFGQYGIEDVEFRDSDGNIT